MLKKNYSFLFLFIILFVSFTSAELTVTPSSFELEKVYGLDSEFTFIINNSETYNFTNISFPTNPYVRIPEILILQSGESKTITGTIFGDNEYIGNQFLEAFFFSGDIGDSEESYIVTISSDGLIDLRDFSIYVGNTVTFVNNNTDELILTFGESTTVLPSSENRTFTVTTPEVLSYYFSDGISSNPITPTYQITILSTSGIVTDPNLNPSLFFNISLIYPQTSISISYLSSDNYLDLSPFEEEEGTIEVRNIGTKIAKNINLDCDWITFSQNNFDLAPGSSKPVTYKISPQVYYTNDTDKTYNKTLSITGNFAPVDRVITIFVPYTQIDAGNYSQGMSLIDWFLDYCEDNPDDEICGGKTTIIYKNASENITIETGNKQFQEFIAYIIASNKEMNKKLQMQSELTAFINLSLSETNNMSTIVLEAVEKSSEQTANINETILTVLLIFMFVIICALLVFLIKLLNKRGKVPTLLRDTWQRIKTQ